jgi:S-adenosylmethionine decarboxylase
MESIQHFGIHLTIDGYMGDSPLLNNMDTVFKCLEELPGRLGMRAITTPYVVRIGANEVKDPGGLSGFTMIAESHISIHTFPADRFVSIDVYTCQNELDDRTVIDYFTETLKLEEVETNRLIRGRRWGELAARFRS